MTLPEGGQGELELQFAGSVVEFSSLTVDTGSCLGQGMYIRYNEVRRHTCNYKLWLFFYSLCFSFFTVYQKVHLGRYTQELS